MFGFGEITDPDYVIPCRQIYEKAMALASGRTTGDWPRVLEEGAGYLAKHKTDFASYISHVVPLSETQEALLAVRSPPGRPTEGGHRSLMIAWLMGSGR